jgi:hypothetical protein
MKTRNLSPRVMRSLLILSALVVAIAVGLLLAARPPSRADKLKSFLGQGEILDSAYKREGLDHSYWARYKCDPAAVRIHLKKHSFPRHESGTQRLEQYFPHTSFDWPPNISHFQKDWIVFTVGVGFYRLVAFPDDNSSEVFFLEYDT